MEQQERSKMLGSMKMTSLVPKVSVPIMISMLVQALYNVVDSMFVAKYDPDALTAVSLAYPIQVLMIAVSTGLGVGINSLISRRLGEKRVEDARDAAKNGFFLLLLGYLLFLIFGLFFDGLFFRMSTKDETLRANAENDDDGRQHCERKRHRRDCWTHAPIRAGDSDNAHDRRGNDSAACIQQCRRDDINIRQPRQQQSLIHQ